MGHKIRADEWMRVHGKVRFELDDNATIWMRYAFPQEGVAYGIPADEAADGEKIPVFVLQGHGKVQATLTDFAALEIETNGIAGIALTIDGRDAGEMLDDEEPPQPADPPNILAKLRQQARQNMGVTREDFMESGGIYEVPEDVEDFGFEEEEAQLAEMLKVQEGKKNETTDKGGAADAEETTIAGDQVAAGEAGSGSGDAGSS